jgi:hypothetical protein
LHVFLCTVSFARIALLAGSKDVDARDKPWHDELGWENRSDDAHHRGTAAEAVSNRCSRS